jgi:CheY-like chemotaxis protein/anti-sigma regulatory factor (Ser/Thr protein kinase)
MDNPVSSSELPAQSKQPARERILVADDDAATREVIADALRKEHYSVTTVSDGKEALARLARAKFDVALLDVWMPRMNGLDVLKALRKKRSPPKVIVITSEGETGAILRAIHERACRCISKPVDPQELVSLVREALARKTQPPRIEVISSKPGWVELRLPCTLEAAELIESFMYSLEADLPSETRAAVSQVFHELLLNAIEWGGHLDPNRKVQVSYLRARHMLLYRIADPGRGFHFENLRHAAIAHNGEPTEHQGIRQRKGLRPGGFGLVLANANADELLYNEAQNEVVFVKYLDGIPRSKANDSSGCLTCESPATAAK